MPDVPHSPAPGDPLCSPHPRQGQASRLPPRGAWSLQTHPGGSAQQGVAPWLQERFPGTPFSLPSTSWAGTSSKVSGGPDPLQPSPLVVLAPPPLCLLPSRRKSPGVPLWSAGARLTPPALTVGAPLPRHDGQPPPPQLPPPRERLCLLVHRSEVPMSGQFQVQGSLCSISCWKLGSPPCMLSQNPWSSRARDHRDERHTP